MPGYALVLDYLQNAKGRQGEMQPSIKRSADLPSLMHMFY